MMYLDVHPQIIFCQAHVIVILMLYAMDWLPSPMMILSFLLSSFCQAHVMEWFNVHMQWIGCLPLWWFFPFGYHHTNEVAYMLVGSGNMNGFWILWFLSAPFWNLGFRKIKSQQIFWPGSVKICFLLVFRLSLIYRLHLHSMVHFCAMHSDQMFWCSRCLYFSWAFCFTKWFDLRHIRPLVHLMFWISIKLSIVRHVLNVVLNGYRWLDISIVY